MGVRTHQVHRLDFFVGHPTQAKVTQISDDYARTYLRLRHVFSCGMRPVPAVKYSGTKKRSTSTDDFKRKKAKPKQKFLT